MKRVLVLSFALSFTCIPLIAQSAGLQQAKPFPPVPPGIETCPVYLHAQQKAAGEMVAADKSRPKGTTQRLQLTLTYPDSKQITRARVTVHGLTAKGRLTPTPVRNHKASNVSRTFDVALSAGPDKKTASADLWVPGMTSVSTVELKSVVFADGSNWTLRGRAACHFVPDPVMLIADR